MSTDKSHAASGEHHFAHHFRSAEHEYVTSKEGIWLFMATEILMFGGLFVGYSIYHSLYPEMFAEGAKYLDWKMGFANTLVLIFSSLTMALGIYFLQRNQPKKAVTALAITILCGAIFMVIKYFEYTHKFHMGIFPGHLLNVAEVKPEHANLGMYFGFYFCMSGLHGIHVLLGMGLITWVLFRTLRGDFNSNHYTAVEGVGIFWHIVDLIWIFLFPLLYLVG
ncbi:cytochrome c oxidase subunit 3 family protein [Bdellovibrio sp. HCB337]|uniref:cytochrome c oxidase subunit 3 family protein n=1 Tax=Bdellovibrio sp. HCB337 TaxID=3394358 RepID=UPI0039A58541